MRVPIEPRHLEEIRARSHIEDAPRGVERSGRRWLRVVGMILLVAGLGACLTIQHAKIGVALLLLGGILILVGRPTA